MEGRSIFTLCNNIFELEEKHNMLDREIKGVPIWQSMRVEFYYRLAKDLNIYSTPHTNLKKKAFIKLLPVLIYNSIFNNPLYNSSNIDAFVFSHQRKVLVDSEYIDIYTKYFLDSLDNTNYEMLEYSYIGNENTSKTKKHMFLDVVTLRRIFYLLFSKIIKKKFTKEELKYINSLQATFKEKFNIVYDLKKIFSDKIIKYNNEFRYYNKLIKKRRPKVIYLVVAYSHPGLIAAAKSNGVKTVELQHGVISKYHLGYHFPNSDKEIKCFPDELYIFGEYWKDSAAFPIDKDRITIMGFKYLQNKFSEYKDIQKDEKQILFISQGVNGGILSEYCYYLAKKLKDYKIVYKLHPGEYARWRDEYDALVKASKLENVKIADSNKESLYRYFAESNYQIGVFSTAIYEGLVFKCKTVLIDLPGIEYMQDLITDNIVYPAKNNEELYKAILKLKDNDLNNILRYALFG